MTIEQRDNRLKSFARDPRGTIRGARTWSPVEIKKGDTPQIKLGKKRSAVLSSVNGIDLLRLESPNYGEREVVANAEINDSRAPWAGKIRWVPELKRIRRHIEQQS